MWVIVRPSVPGIMPSLSPLPGESIAERARRAEGLQRPTDVIALVDATTGEYLGLCMYGVE